MPSFFFFLIWKARVNLVWRNWRAVSQRMLRNDEIKRKIEVGKFCVCRDQINCSVLCFCSPLWVLGSTCGKRLMLWKSQFFIFENFFMLRKLILMLWVIPTLISLYESSENWNIRLLVTWHGDPFREEEVDCKWLEGEVSYFFFLVPIEHLHRALDPTDTHCLLNKWLTDVNSDPLQTFKLYMNCLTQKEGRGRTVRH